MSNLYLRVCYYLFDILIIIISLTTTTEKFEININISLFLSKSCLFWCLKRIRESPYFKCGLRLLCKCLTKHSK